MEQRKLKSPMISDFNKEFLHQAGMSMSAVESFEKIETLVH